jgi:hypothetical protein
MSIKMLSEQVIGSRREYHVAYRTYRIDITTDFLLQWWCPERKVSDATCICIIETRVFIKIQDKGYMRYLQNFLHLLSQIFFIYLSGITNVSFLNKVSLLVMTLFPLVYKLREDITKDFPLCATPLIHLLPLLMICNQSYSQYSTVGPNKSK